MGLHFPALGIVHPQAQVHILLCVYLCVCMCVYNVCV